MYEARCIKCNKKLAELGRKPIYALSCSKICKCGRKIIGSISTNIKKDEVVAHLKCACGYNKTKVMGHVVSVKCKRCKAMVRF